MKRYLSFFGGMILSGCLLESNALQYQTMSDTNVYHLFRVSIGMSQYQVLQIMHKPFHYETFDFRCDAFDDQIYDVWFYVTRPTGLDQTRMVPQNLTPLTFRNGCLVSKGYSYYNYLVKVEACAMAGLGPEVEMPKVQKQETEGLEKTLKTIQQQPTPLQPQQKPAEEEKLPPNVRIIGKNERTSTQKTTPLGVISHNEFSQLKKGMTEAEVIKILGVTADQDTWMIGNDVYNIWFYEGIIERNTPPVTIPLTFKNGILVGTTFEEYQELNVQMPRECEEDPDEERMMEDESEQNFNFW